MGKNITKKTLAIFLMPVLIYLVMLFISMGRGITFNMFESVTFMNIFKKTSYMAIIALGIGFQLSFGRFDFSGGAITVIAAMIGARICAPAETGATGLGLPLLFLICIVSAIAMSLLHSVIYVKFKVPISVISLATCFFLESFSGVIIDKTINLSILNNYVKMYNTWLVAIPLVLALGANFIFSRFTTAGKQATLLARNQTAAVNIGINEKKNTIICYAVSGFIFGCAAVLYSVSNMLDPITVPLSTAGTLFSNIIPSLVGLFLSRYIDGTLGTLVGAFSIQTLYYGLDVNGISGGVKTICYACFLAIFIFISGFWDQLVMTIMSWIDKIKFKTRKKSKDEN